MPATIVRLGGDCFRRRATATRRWSSSALSGLTTPTEAAELDEDEDIEPGRSTLREARDMIRRGEIVDMKTVGSADSAAGSWLDPI